MSFKLKEYNAKVTLPDADLCLEEVSALYKLMVNFTPKIEGRWNILIVNPTIKECKELLDNKQIPEWMDIIIYLQAKKLEQVCLEFPEYQPKNVPFKEQAKELLTSVNHLIDKKAFSILVEAFRGNLTDLQKMLIELDENCTGPRISIKDVQAKVNYVRPTYASDVINSFLLQEKQRWVLLNKLVQALGDSYAYNALYKYVKTLLHEKNKYLNNQDVDLRVVNRIDAPSICYAYTIFSTSTNHQQLYGIFQAIDNRCQEYLERMTDVNLQ